MRPVLLATAAVLALALPGTRADAQRPTLDGAARWADSARRTIEAAQLAGDSAKLAAARGVVDHDVIQTAES